LGRCLQEKRAIAYNKAKTKKNKCQSINISYRLYTYRSFFANNEQQYPCQNTQLMSVGYVFRFVSLPPTPPHQRKFEHSLIPRLVIKYYVKRAALVSNHSEVRGKKREPHKSNKFVAFFFVRWQKKRKTLYFTNQVNTKQIMAACFSAQAVITY
jgi:hypothetical protein